MASDHLYVLGAAALVGGAVAYGMYGKKTLVGTPNDQYFPPSPIDIFVAHGGRDSSRPEYLDKAGYDYLSLVPQQKQLVTYLNMVAGYQNAQNNRSKDVVKQPQTITLIPHPYKKDIHNFGPVQSS
jgi:poly(3-hydroxybutyrate) depolymerase